MYKSKMKNVSSTSKWAGVRELVRHEHAVLIIIIVIMMSVLTFAAPGKFLTRPNALNIVLQSSVRGIAAIGQTFVILTGNIDLTIGGLALFAGVMGAGVMTESPTANFVGHPMGIGFGILTILGIAVGIGAINGLAVSRIRMPSLIVTLAMWQVTKGLAYMACGGFAIRVPQAFAIFGQSFIAGIPVPIIIFISITAIAHFVLIYTSFGRTIYAVGGNPVAAYLSGIDVSRVLLTVFLTSGFLTGIASLITTSRIMSGSMQSTTGLELDSIAAVSVGGVSLFGGKGSIVGALLGVILMGLISNGIIVTGLDPSYQDVLRGAVIFTAVGVDVLRRR